MTITYVFEGNLYVNLTNRCPNRCDFCLRNNTDTVGDSDSLWLKREPTVEEVIEDIKKRDLREYKQLVFCGFGEPTCRLDDMKEIAKAVKEFSSIDMRLNTNGLSDLINKRSTAKDFDGLIETISISLNASTAENYDKRCKSIFGLEALPAIIKFTKDVRFYVPNVVMTVVDTMDKSEIDECREICKEIGADFRVREYID